MRKAIHIEIRNNYGNPAAYPACGDAEAFARIAGTKTLTRQTLRNVFQLGYSVIEVTHRGTPCGEYRAESADEQYNLLATMVKV